MGILDGIVDWLATQVMNLLDLASASVLGALGCNMDTFKRYFPAASAMYEIFIWTAIGLVLLNLVWQLYRCYGAGFDIDTENPINLVVRSVIFLLLMNFSKNGKTVDDSRAWLKRIAITWAILNGLGFIMAYVTPFFQGGTWNP